MTELVRVPLDGGGVVVAEVDRSDVARDGVVLAAPEPGRVVAQLSQTLESGVRSIRPALDGLMSVLREAAPDTVSVEFGMKLGGETGIILAKGTVEANFKVRLEWQRSPAGVVSPAAEEPGSDRPGSEPVSGEATSSRADGS